MATQTSTNRGGSYGNRVALSLSDIFYPIYQRYLDGKDITDKIGEDLKRANIKYPAEVYISSRMGAGIVGGVISGFVFAIIFVAFVLGQLTLPSMPTFGVGLPSGVEIPSVMFVAMQYLASFVALTAVGGYLGGFTGVLYARYRPYFAGNSREREIDLILPDVVAFMYSLSVGGANQIKIFHDVADAEDQFGEASVEFQRIVAKMEYFNMDYQSAVREVADVTPSDELDSFLLDMLSIIESGGDMTNFLDNQQDVLRKRAEKKEKEQLDSIELFSEMYVSLTVLPMGILIVLVIVSAMADPHLGAFLAAVYIIIPVINIGFGVMIGMTKQGTVGSDELDTEGHVVANPPNEYKINDTPIIDHFEDGEYGGMFNSFRNYERRHRIMKALANPHQYLRANPIYVLFFTVPATALYFGLMAVSGVLAVSVNGIVADPYLQTFYWFYIPAFINLVPLTIFYEWKMRTRGKITDTLTRDLRKLQSANDAGQPLLEAMKTTTKGSQTMLAREFEEVYAKAQHNTDLSPALVGLSNKYKQPRLARATKLIDKAHEASANIANVLKVAAENSRMRDEIIEERKQRTQLQVAIMATTFLIFLGVLIALDVFFVDDIMADIDGDEIDTDRGQIADISAGLDPNLISLLFFHAVTIQAVCAGMLSGYMQKDDIMSGLKYTVAYLLVAGVAYLLVM